MSSPLPRMSPIEAASRLARARGRVLLHSGRDDDGCGRESFLACEPYRSIESRRRHIVIRDASGAVIEERDGDPIAALQRELERADGGNRTLIGPVPSAIGFLGYDIGRSVERIGPAPSRGGDVPDMWIGFYGAVARWAASDLVPEIVGASGEARAVLSERLCSPASADSPSRTSLELGPLVADDGVEAYAERVHAILEYIRAGDIYQANLARRWVARVESTGDALELYRALDQHSAAPFGGLIEADGVTVVSGSPELFLRRRRGSDRVETRPIKGTCRRGGSEAENDARAHVLQRDPKEQAEHLMIVDLERNDLGRIAETGSVRVDRLGYLVELPTLFHLVSTVSCQVRSDVTTADVLRATFPSGSITGAPKIRAMQIIDELEPAARGPYTGAVGYFGAGGVIELAIAIRTAVLTETELRLHMGGGIVADSTAERELEETEEKAAAWRRSLASFARC